MSTLGLETIFVGNVVHSVLLTIVSDIRVEAAHNNSLILSAQILDLTLLLCRFSITGLNALKSKKKRRIKYMQMAIGTVRALLVTYLYR